MDMCERRRNPGGAPSSVGPQTADARAVVLRLRGWRRGIESPHRRSQDPLDRRSSMTSRNLIAAATACAAVLAGCTPPPPAETAAPAPSAGSAQIDIGQRLAKYTT